MRAGKILGGLILAYVNSIGSTDTVLGFYLPNSAERIGFDVAKVLLYVLSGWLIYRGFRPAIKRPVTPTSA
jgi:hypothetical protein